MTDQDVYIVYENVNGNGNSRLHLSRMKGHKHRQHLGMASVDFGSDYYEQHDSLMDKQAKRMRYDGEFDKIRLPDGSSMYITQHD